MRRCAYACVEIACAQSHTCVCVCRVQAGCDPRATCSEPVPGDVQCACKDSVTEALPGAEPGVRCRQAPVSTSFFRRNHANVTIRKPYRTELSFYTAVEGESHAITTIDSEAAYIKAIVAAREFNLSAARPSDEKEFPVSVLSTGTGWSDAETRTTDLTVSVSRQSQPSPEVQRVIVSFALKPYPSCVHTTVTVVKSQLEHTDEALIMLHPKDAEDLPIVQTEFSYTLQLYYEGDEKPIIERHLTAGQGSESSLVSVGQQHLSRAGSYHVALKLSDGWIDRTAKNGPCFVRLVLNESSFTVSCASGYEQNAVNNECVRIDFNNQCQAAKVHMKGLLDGATKKTATAKIGSSDHLSVTMRGNQTASSLKLLWTPLKAVQESSIVKGLAVDTIGNFKVELTDNNSTQTCTIFNNLTVECDTEAGFTGVAFAAFIADYLISDVYPLPIPSSCFLPAQTLKASAPRSKRCPRMLARGYLHACALVHTEKNMCKYMHIHACACCIYVCICMCYACLCFVCTCFFCCKGACVQ